MSDARIKPDKRQKTGRIVSDLILGLPVCLELGETQLVVAAAQTLGVASFKALRDHTPHLAITARRANVLKASVYDGALTRIRLPRDADTTWLRAMADPSLDLQVPMKGPFTYHRDGSAALDLVAIELCKLARLLPAVLCVASPSPDLTTGLTRLDVEADYAPFEADTTMHEVVGARVPLNVFDEAQVRIFQQDNEFQDHYAVIIGAPRPEDPVLTRLHSACFTGDVLGSRKCDCGAQLDAALQKMADEGGGILLYLNQEGRGIGLANKLRAYALQDEGYDTVEANHRLGFEDDERDLQTGARLLRAMGFGKVRLMTNNPAKVERMRAAGVTVTARVPHVYGVHEGNAHYLDTKAKKSGHIL